MCKLIVGFIFGLGMILMSNAAAAQSVCGPRNEVVDQLAKKYQELPVAIGVTSLGGLVEVLTSGDGSTWTIIVSLPDGTACMVAAGEGWRTMEWAIEGPET